MATIAGSRRLRRTPFSDGVEAAGVKGYSSDCRRNGRDAERPRVCDDFG